MPISRDEKEKIVAELADDLGKVQALILTDYRGMPVADLARVRNQLRGMKSQMHIVKNTLFTLALKRAGMPVPEDLLEGPTAVTFCYSDISGPAKVINDFLKEKELPLKGAILSGSVLKGAEAAALANLPSRELLYGRLLGTINAPGTRVAGVVASGIRKIMYLLQARAEQLQKQEA